MNFASPDLLLNTLKYAVSKKNITHQKKSVFNDPRHLGVTKRAQNKKGAGKKVAEQKGREITMLRHRYIQGRNFFR